MCNPVLYPPLVRASSVTAADGAVTVTVPSTVDFTRGGVYDIGLFTSIPSGTDGATVSVTNGTLTGYVMAPNGDYFRSYPLSSRTILRVQWFDDPAHFQIIPTRPVRSGRKPL